jgi:2-oxoglutarate ferredoxin oxidoreductase subunit beta
MLGQVTATTPYGRDVDLNGYPLKITELLAQLPGAAYVTRQSVHTPANVRKCKKAIRKAFEIQQRKLGLRSLKWFQHVTRDGKLTRWLQTNGWKRMFPFNPLGDLKDSERLDTEQYKVQKLKK